MEVREKITELLTLAKAGKLYWAKVPEKEREELRVKYENAPLISRKRRRMKGKTSEENEDGEEDEEEDEEEEEDAPKKKQGSSSKSAPQKSAPKKSAPKPAPKKAASRLKRKAPELDEEEEAQETDEEPAPKKQRRKEGPKSGKGATSSTKKMSTERSKKRKRQTSGDDGDEAPPPQRSKSRTTAAADAEALPVKCGSGGNAWYFLGSQTLLIKLYGSCGSAWERLLGHQRDLYKKGQKRESMRNATSDCLTGLEGLRDVDEVEVTATSKWDLSHFFASKLQSINTTHGLINRARARRGRSKTLAAELAEADNAVGQDGNSNGQRGNWEYREVTPSNDEGTETHLANKESRAGYRGGTHGGSELSSLSPDSEEDEDEVAGTMVLVGKGDLDHGKLPAANLDELRIHSPPRVHPYDILEYFDEHTPALLASDAESSKEEFAVDVPGWKTVTTKKRHKPSVEGMRLRGVPIIARKFFPLNFAAHGLDTSNGERDREGNAPAATTYTIPALPQWMPMNFDFLESIKQGFSDNEEITELLTESDSESDTEIQAALFESWDHSRAESLDAGWRASDSRINLGAVIVEIESEDDKGASTSGKNDDPHDKGKGVHSEEKGPRYEEFKQAGPSKLHPRPEKPKPKGTHQGKSKAKEAA
ncbi:hypothetical protein B0H14DRAFT_3658426 [Mycena olivaceomarginata]|nr:hypothetical protein B0H14DRAFT_3658426 [Mycena olivaceomarginata]